MTIEAVLPAVVVSAEATTDDPAAVLFPEEEAFIGGAVEKRRREYATVRQCARRALAVFGLPPAPILSGNSRDPLWPPGMVGSMTHCEGYRAAAVARAAMVHTIGIDAEPNDPLPNGIIRAVLTPSECLAVRELADAEPAVSWDRLFFSAKEAVYKAWYPVMRTWLGFEDAEIALNLNESSFTATLMVHEGDAVGSPPKRFCGRWLAEGGLLMTAVAPIAE
jgi:4'-phosphopantetheinyl transferase EntD